MSLASIDFSTDWIFVKYEDLKRAALSSMTPLGQPLPFVRTGTDKFFFPLGSACSDVLHPLVKLKQACVVPLVVKGQVFVPFEFLLAERAYCAGHVAAISATLDVHFGRR